VGIPSVLGPIPCWGSLGSPAIVPNYGRESSPNSISPPPVLDLGDNARYVYPRLGVHTTATSIQISDKVGYVYHRLGANTTKLVSATSIQIGYHSLEQDKNLD